MFEPVRSSLIAREKEPVIADIIAAIKEYESNQLVVRFASQPQVKVEDIGNEAMAAHRGGVGDFDWGNSKGREGVCFRCGKPGHVAAKCVADMPPNIKTKILSHSNTANVADVDDYAFLTDDFENVALVSAFGMGENVPSSSVLDSGSVGSEELKVVSSGRKCRVRSRRVKVVRSQPEYAF